MSNMGITSLSRDYMAKMLAEGKRFDKRGVFDMRDVELELEVSNKAEGSVRVRLGKTDVLVGVKVGVGTPYPDSANKGNLMVTGELLPIASPRVEHGPPSFKAIELGRLVDRAIRESGMVDFKGLCIEEGEKVWTVFVDVYPMNDDGNLLDAASIGAVVALQNAKLPGLTAEGKVDYNVHDKPLPLSKEIAPLSFSFYKIGDSIILDPTREEEELADARATFGVSNWNGKLMMNSCQKIGKATFSGDEVETMMVEIEKAFDSLSKKVYK